MTTPELQGRLASLTSWRSEWDGLRVVVLGLGVAAFSSADTLTELGADVLVVADAYHEERARLLDVIGARLHVGDLSVVPGAVTEFAPEVVVVSSGRFHPDHPVLAWAEQAGVAVWSDVELAWRVRDKIEPAAEWICITGTNGKTTTVELTATFLVASGVRAAPCGNIGIPVLDAVRDPEGFDVLVVELSSYQLHWLNRNAGGEVFPFSSACLNLAEDHLDFHGSMQAYGAAKAKVYENTKIACVYNKADLATLRMVEEAEVVEGARAVGFGLDSPGPSEFGIVDGILCDRAFLEDRATTALELTTIDELRAAGLAAPHVVANILAAAALSRSYGVPAGVIHDALATFRLDPHRIETVAAHDGVLWVDDSKATNPHAADASLRAFENVVWIVGGDLKGVAIDDLVRRHADRLSGAVVIGLDQEPVLAAFRRHAPQVRVLAVASGETETVMPQAVRFAARLAKEGDTVLLAPAAASLDQFADFADRGDRFAKAVHDLLADDQGPDAS
ncbi:UDP-N-acetylmuramoyl-L-alanine--D-glutamate ligase [Rathayibacter sp. KR2-224]|uniref:UDP-N-acetylmuramoyl-L-alanine--D-glutamate ligase n=1 Tax=Rathayibacter sp. KR2-224 TaxID=3400913 RepID=UPI003BFCB4F1